LHFSGFSKSIFTPKTRPKTRKDKKNWESSLQRSELEENETIDREGCV